MRVQASDFFGFMLVPPTCHNTSAQGKQLKDTKLIKTTTACILACDIHPRGHVVSNKCSGMKKQPVSKHVGFFFALTEVLLYDGGLDWSPRSDQRGQGSVNDDRGESTVVKSVHTATANAHLTSHF